MASGLHRAPPVLRAVEVRKRYSRRQALRGVSLEVRPGETVCIIGPSGSGKTTLLRCLAGVEEIDSGQIEVTVPVILQSCEGLSPAGLMLFDGPAEPLDAIEQLAHEGTTMLIATGTLSFLKAAADRVLMMDEGAIIEQGPPEHFFLEPREARTRQFLLADR